MYVREKVRREPSRKFYNPKKWAIVNQTNNEQPKTDAINRMLNPMIEKEEDTPISTTGGKETVDDDLEAELELLLGGENGKWRTE